MKKFIYIIAILLIGNLGYAVTAENQVTNTNVAPQETAKPEYSVETKYNKNYLNATISNNTIIPGLSGSVIDINNSYLKMKKIKSFQENSLILKEIEPVISIKNNQDKYIISGNHNKKNIAILIKTNNLDILKYYENTNINLIVTLL